jgi:hypothetical protein
MTRPAIYLAVLLTMTGCATKKSSLLLERRARGPLAETGFIGQRAFWKLDPASQTQVQNGVEVHVDFASQEYLQRFFSNRELFKEYAGHNPYFHEDMVFYVHIANKSEKPIRFNPVEFVLVDDRGDQYNILDADYIDVLEDARQPYTTATRDMLQDARPGYFGMSLPVGRLVASKPQDRFARIKQSSMLPSLLHPGVVYDGLVAYWSPNPKSVSLRLLVTNIKTDFDPKGDPQTALTFPFTFKVLGQ